jgi:hypothetical protein
VIHIRAALVLTCERMNKAIRLFNVPFD